MGVRLLVVHNGRFSLNTNNKTLDILNGNIFFFQSLFSRLDWFPRIDFVNISYAHKMDCNCVIGKTMFLPSPEAKWIETKAIKRAFATIRLEMIWSKRRYGVLLTAVDSTRHFPTERNETREKKKRKNSESPITFNNGV